MTLQEALQAAFKRGRSFQKHVDCQKTDQQHDALCDYVVKRMEELEQEVE
jgi:hypothetical protein